MCRSSDVVETLPMSNEQCMKEVVTISEMARMTHLSRSRFYQLMKEGVFPEPQRNPTTNRPFYNRDQQDQCMEVRRRNCGINGRPVLFYTRSLVHPISPPAKKRPLRPKVAKPGDRSRNNRDHRDPVIDELKHGLAQLGMAGVEESAIKTALAEEYPDGWKNVDRAVLLMAVFRRLRSQVPPVPAD